MTGPRDALPRPYSDRNGNPGSGAAAEPDPPLKREPRDFSCKPQDIGEFIGKFIERSDLSVGEQAAGSSGETAACCFPCRSRAGKFPKASRSFAQNRTAGGAQ
jgi:hypothetical protein